jgi:hypothetical protein
MLFVACATVLTGACGDFALVRDAKAAEADGRTIHGKVIGATYPQSFTSGGLPYLERDFEAGADFIGAQRMQNLIMTFAPMKT